MNGLVTVIQMVINKDAPGQKVSQLVMNPRFVFQGIVKGGVEYTESEPNFPCTFQFNVDPSKKFLNLIVKGNVFRNPVSIKVALLFANASDIRKCTGFEFDETFKNLTRPMHMVQSGKMYQIEKQVTMYGKRKEQNWQLRQAGHAGSLQLRQPMVQAPTIVPVKSELEDMIGIQDQPTISVLRLKVITSDTEDLSIAVAPSATVHNLKVKLNYS